jgi:hypothetical protein
MMYNKQIMADAQAARTAYSKRYMPSVNYMSVGYLSSVCHYRQVIHSV